MSKKSELETKKIAHYGKTNEIVKRVITSDEPISIKHDGIIYTYDRETNTLTLTDAFGSTHYEPAFMDGMIFPFNKRKDMEVY